MARQPQKLMNDPAAVHCMFDIETLGSADDSPIVQIGAVLFNPFAELTDGSRQACGQGSGIISAAGFNGHVAFDGAGIDPQTLLWWFAQGQQAQQRVFGRDIERAHIAHVLASFGGWATTWGQPVDFWWSDMDFDLRMLRAAWAREVDDRFGAWPCPFGSEDGPHRGVRDCRTMRAVGALMGLAPPLFVGVEHDALDDAHHQAIEVSNVLRAISEQNSTPTS